MMSSFAFSYLACCGPTFPGSCELLADNWDSFIAPDSIPSAFRQFSVRAKNEKQTIKWKKIYDKITNFSWTFTFEKRANEKRCLENNLYFPILSERDSLFLVYAFQTFSKTTAWRLVYVLWKSDRERETEKGKSSTTNAVEEFVEKIIIIVWNEVHILCAATVCERVNDCWKCVAQERNSIGHRLVCVACERESMSVSGQFLKSFRQFWLFFYNI